MMVMGVRRTRVNPLLHGIYTAGGAAASVMRFIGALFDALFRIGFTVLFKAPVAMLGLVFAVCACLVLVGVGQRIYQYNHSPREQLQSARNALVGARQMDQNIAAMRRAKGLPPVSSDQLFAPPLETEIAKLRAELAAFEPPSAGR